MITKNYTCKDYREEMTLIGLQKRLRDENLSDSERIMITKEIKAIEKRMDMD